jgi:hypothetical protein
MYDKLTFSKGKDQLQQYIPRHTPSAVDVHMYFLSVQSAKLSHGKHSPIVNSTNCLTKGNSWSLYDFCIQNIWAGKRFLARVERILL